jgi:hypothetical protein
MKIGNVCPVNKVERPPEPPYLGDVRQIVAGPHESVEGSTIHEYDDGRVCVCKHCGALYWESTDE